MLSKKTIVLGITGGIPAYKAADIASKLVQEGAEVRVIMTESATRFITPTTLHNITKKPVATDIFKALEECGYNHIGMSELADIIVIAPATANTIARLANGIADDMLSCTVLATKVPIVISPAMNDNMFQNPITQENIAKLKARGFTIIEPAYGRLLSGKVAMGRMPETNIIIDTVKMVLGRNGDMAGKRIVVTAGGTREPIDPVRYIGNRSSGKMGYAIAEAARDRGATVTLITTVAHAVPNGVEVIKVETAFQMKEAVDKAVAGANALIMAAAVADYKPKSAASNKIKKTSANLNIELIKTPDILAEVKGDFVKVGFAAESEELIAYARRKLEQKRLHLIVANDITEQDSGFGADTNKVFILDRNGKVEDLPLLPKREIADKILDRAVGLMGNGNKKSTIDSRRVVAGDFIHNANGIYLLKSDTSIIIDAKKSNGIVGDQLAKHGLWTKNLIDFYYSLRKKAGLINTPTEDW